MPESAATKNMPPSTTSEDEQGEVTKPTFQHAPISPSTATTNSNPVPNAESSTSPSPPSKKDFDNKKRTIKIPSVFIAIFATPLHFFHPTKSPVILSHPIFLITPYIFISLGFMLCRNGGGNDVVDDVQDVSAVSGAHERFGCRRQDMAQMKRLAAVGIVRV